MNEEMNNEWKIESLGKFLIPFPKSKHPSGISDESGYYKFYVCSKEINKSFQYDMKEPSVLFSTGGEAAVHYAFGKYSYSTDVWATKFTGNLTNDFVYRFLELNIEKINNLGFQGSGIKHLDKDYIKKIHIKFPSLPEQKKIASILTSVDEVIENTKRHIDKLQDLKKATMNVLFTKGIGHTEFKDSDLGIIPKNWQIKTIYELGNYSKNTVQTGPFGAELHARDYVKIGVPLILIKNIKEYGLDSSDIPKITEEDAERLNKYRLKEGDIVFSRVGRVGSSFQVEKNQIGWVISGQMLRIRIINNELEKSFLNIILNSEKVKKELKEDSVGSTRTSINTKILENLKLLLPPKIEQSKINSIIHSLSNDIKIKKQKLSKIQSLKKSLMQDLLTGKVRVRVN